LFHAKAHLKKNLGGIPVEAHFTDIAKNLSSKDLEIKIMSFYLLNEILLKHPDLEVIILCISTLLKVQCLLS
jgi:hypothetical protein